MKQNVRVIPRLDIKGPNLVKGIHFEGLRVLGKPEEFASFYYEQGADELVYIDAVASLYGRNSLLDLVKKTSLNKITDFKSRYSLSNKTIIYVGRTSREKSLDILLLAFNQVVRKEPEAKLLIIGEGPALGGLKELSKALGLEKKVIFTGKIDHQKLLQSGAYEIASLFATASTSEVQPMSVLEAIAFGLPIVGVKARGMEELIRGNGILFNPGDINGLSKGMIKILRNESLREKFSQRSKGLIKKEYLLDNIIEKLEKAYKDLLQ